MTAEAVSRPPGGDDLGRLLLTLLYMASTLGAGRRGKTAFVDAACDDPPDRRTES